MGHQTNPLSFPYSSCLLILFYLCLHSFQSFPASVNLYFLHYCPYFHPYAFLTPNLPHLSHTSIIFTLTHLSKNLFIFYIPGLHLVLLFTLTFIVLCVIFSPSPIHFEFSPFFANTLQSLSLSLYCACSRLCDQSGGHVLSSDTLQCSVRLHKTLQSTFFFLSDTDS